MKEQAKEGVEKGRIGFLLALGVALECLPSRKDLPVFEARQIPIPLLNTCTRNRKSN